MLKEQLIVAIDKSDFNEALGLCNEIRDYVGFFKLGLEFFVSFGVDGVNKIADLGVPIFLDLKLHDIPNTVSKAVEGLVKSVNGVEILTLHASGGEKMLADANRILSKTVSALGKKRPKVFGVTVLTSTAGESDSWGGHKVLFPFAVVVGRGIKTIEDLKQTGNESAINFALQKLAVTVKACNNSLPYWTHLTDGEDGRIEAVNKKLKDFGLELAPEIGTKLFYKKNFDVGVLNEVLYLSDIAFKSSIEGVVCSAQEVKFVKQFFPNLLTITPGIRPKWYSIKDDQQRTVTPQEAVKSGSDFIVIGRPITESPDPKSAIIKTLNGE